MKRKFGLGLFIGRFQPFHNGHLYALNFANSCCKRIVIGVGSTQESGTERNPLSAKERIKIIKSGLRNTKMGLTKTRFISIPDFSDDEKWFNYILVVVPDVDVVFSRNRIVMRIFKKHNIAVISPPWHMREKLAATKIRAMIKKGGNWRSRVPRGAVNEIAAQEENIKHAKTNK